jgi:hypothetical protein
MKKLLKIMFTLLLYAGLGAGGMYAYQERVFNTERNTYEEKIDDLDARLADVQPKNAQRDDAVVLLNGLPEAVGATGSAIRAMEFEWNHDGAARLINGKGTELRNLSAEQQKKVEGYFLQAGYEKSAANSTAGPPILQGYRKESAVCMIQSNIAITAEGELSPTGAMNVVSKCGELD